MFLSFPEFLTNDFHGLVPGFVREFVRHGIMGQSIPSKTLRSRYEEELKASPLEKPTLANVAASEGRMPVPDTDVREECLARTKHMHIVPA